MWWVTRNYSGKTRQGKQQQKTFVSQVIIIGDSSCVGSLLITTGLFPSSFHFIAWMCELDGLLVRDFSTGHIIFVECFLYCEGGNSSHVFYCLNRYLQNKMVKRKMSETDAQLNLSSNLAKLEKWRKGITGIYPSQIETIQRALLCLMASGPWKFFSMYGVCCESISIMSLNYIYIKKINKKNFFITYDTLPASCSAFLSSSAAPISTFISRNPAMPMIGATPMIINAISHEYTKPIMIPHSKLPTDWIKLPSRTPVACKW